MKGTRYEILARDRAKSIAFSRRSPATRRPIPPSFSNCARNAAGVRPARVAKRSISWSISCSVTTRPSRRAIASSTSALATDGPRRLPLRLPELGPVDAGLPRVHILLHKLTGELLEPPIDLALDERDGELERDALRELLQHLAAKLSRDVLLGLGLQIGANAVAQRGDRVELAHVLRELVVQFGQHAAAKLLRPSPST